MKDILKSNDDIRQQLLIIKSYTRILTAQSSTIDITKKINEVKHQRMMISADTHGDKVGYCLSFIDNVLDALQDIFYSACIREAQENINLMILSSQLSKRNKLWCKNRC